MITLHDVKHDDEIVMMVCSANEALEARGYTEHGVRHVSYVSRTAANILAELGYDDRTVELAAITGWVHDVGNLVNRKYHGLTGATIIMPVLTRMGMPMDEVCQIAGAIGNHEEEYGSPLNTIGAALILADKSDAHRTRVRRNTYNPKDIHDRVNYSIKKHRIVVDKKQKKIRFEMIMDTTSSVMEYFRIFLDRMVMSEKAANFLGCTYELYVNGVMINTPIPIREENSLKDGETEVSV